MTVFYFTATGNCLSVAKRIGGILISIPQIIDSDNLYYKDDVIGIVFPIYVLKTPKIIDRFLSKVKFEADYTFAIGTYGNLPGAAMMNLQKQALENGERFDYVNHLLMVDNYLPMFEMDFQIRKLPQKRIEENMSIILEDIQNRKHNQMKSSLAMRILTAMMKSRTVSDGYAKNYSVNSWCDKCGVCANVCPVKNIALTDKVGFSDHCEGCMACIHLCSKNAIHLKNERSYKRWRNPDVPLKEIIDANNRDK